MLMSRELRRVLIVIGAATLGFIVLVLLRVLAGEPALQPNDVWVAVVGVAAALLLILLTLATSRARPPRRR